MVRYYYTTKWQPVMGYDGKIVGQSDGHVFKKKIKGSKHLLRKPPAIGIDAPAYEQEIAPTCERIEVFDMESNRLYVSTIENFQRNRGELDRGHGRQVYLILNRWQVTDLSPNAPRQLGFALEGAAHV